MCFEPFSHWVSFIEFKIYRRCRHSSVDSSLPSILPPRVQVPSTPSAFLSIYIWIVSCGKDENKQKEAGIGQFFEKNSHNPQSFMSLVTKKFYSIDPWPGAAGAWRWSVCRPWQESWSRSPVRRPLGWSNSERSSSTRTSVHLLSSLRA